MRFSFYGLVDEFSLLVLKNISTFNSILSFLEMENQESENAKQTAPQGPPVEDEGVVNCVWNLTVHFSEGCVTIGEIVKDLDDMEKAAEMLFGCQDPSVCTYPEVKFSHRNQVQFISAGLQAASNRFHMSHVYARAPDGWCLLRMLFELP